MESPSTIRTTTPSNAVADAVPRAVQAPRTAAIAAKTRVSAPATMARRERSKSGRTMATRCHTGCGTVYLWIRLLTVGSAAALDDRRGDHRGKTGQRKRLRDVIEGALANRRAREVVVAHPAQHHDRGLARERAEHVEPGRDARQVQVEQDHRGWMLARRRESGHRVGRTFDVIAFDGEVIDDELSHAVFIVHDE